MTISEEIEVLDVVEQEDGSSLMTFDMSQEALKSMAQYGLKFVLYCAAYDVTIDEAFNRISGRNGG
jgi:hypothetical protein